MRTLYEGRVIGVRRALDVQFAVDASKPVLVFHGPAGSGKSSALLGVGWGLAGEVRTLELGKLSKEQVGNPQVHSVVELSFCDPEDPSCGMEETPFRLMRTLTMGGAHDLIVNGQKFAKVTDANAALGRALGCSLEQLGYLTSAQALVGMDGLAQGSLICGLLGAEIDLEWLKGKLGAEAIVVWDWSRATAGLTGFPMLEAARVAMEAARTEQSRTKKTAEAEATAAQQRVMELCREARIPGPGNVASEFAQAEAAATRAQTRLYALREAATKAQAYRVQLSSVQATLAQAEQRVAALKMQRAEADAVREEREAERAKLQEAFAAAQAAEDETRRAETAAYGACERAHDAQKVASATYARVMDVQVCPTCKQAIGEELVAQLHEARDEAMAAWKTAEETKNVRHEEHQQRVRERQEAEKALDECPAVPADTELEAQFKQATAASDEAYELLEKLQAQQVPQEPTAEAIQAAQAEAEGFVQRQATLDQVALAIEVQKQNDEFAREQSTLYDRHNQLVDRLRELVREVAAEAIDPVIERSNAMLAGRLILGYDNGAGICAEYDKIKRPVRELSTGERLMVGVTLQASVAIALGVGVALVDEASGWDPETAAHMLEEMVKIGREQYITWLVASAQPVPEVPGVQVVDVRGGYS